MTARRFKILPAPLDPFRVSLSEYSLPMGFFDLFQVVEDGMAQDEPLGEDLHP